MFSLKVGFSDGISILDSILFVIELSRIGVCKFLLIDAATSLRKEELILHEFLLFSNLCAGGSSRPEIPGMVEETWLVQKLATEEMGTS